MSDICAVCLLGLMILSSLLTGLTGDTHVFISSGVNVSLPCNNARHDCTSITCNYNKYWTSGGTELFARGIKKNNIDNRLSLGSDCSLNIYKTTQEDHGEYTCQQYVNGQRHETDERVFLHVLHVSLSSSQTEMRSGRSVTLSCQLFSYESCDSLIRFEGIQLVWENQAGVNLQTDSRYQILSSRKNCIITLTTKLRNEDNNTEFRCLIKKRNEIKTSTSYTVRFMGSKTDTVIPVTTIKSETTSTIDASETEDSRTHVSLYRVIIVIVEITVFVAPTVILLHIICERRAENKRTQNAHPEEIISTN